MDIVFVGGGQASLVMLDYFQQDEHVRIVGVVDLNNDAPGMRRARELGIPTSNDMKAAITRPNVGAVLEVTGNAKVRKMISDLLRPDQDLMTAGSARMMSDVLARVTEKRNGDVCDELGRLGTRMNSTIDAVDRASVEIAKVLRAIRILALNGNIEAARAGQAGAAFAVVVDEMHNLVEQVQSAVASITTSAQDVHSVLDAMRKAEQQLRNNTEQGALARHDATASEVAAPAAG